MKNLTFLRCILVAIVAFAFASCENDSREDELQAGLNGLEKRMEVLETLQDQITAIQQLLEAADRNHITSIEDVTDATGRTGFKINFKDSDPITIYNGVNGVDGVDGDDAPTISVKKDADNLFYWTLNGEFLEVDGKKVLAEGKNGTNAITPKLKIENNTWMVSYDNGATYKPVEGATTGGAVSSAVSYEDKGSHYEFTINGSSINIPKYIPLTIAFTYGDVTGNSFVAGSSNGGDSYEISYEVSGMYPEQIPVIEVIGKDGYTASVDAAAKKITITAPTPWKAGSVLVFVSDGDQRTIMRTISFRQDGTGGTAIEIADGDANQTLEADATSVTLKYNTDIKDENLVVTIGYTGTATGWLTQNAVNAITRAELVAKTLTFTVQPNTSTEDRTATVTISDKINTDLKQVFTITQKKAAPNYYEVSEGTTLASLLGDKVNTASSLEVRGTLTAADWTTLKTMATSNALVSLDISRVTNTEIPTEAFRGAAKLTTIKLPNNLVTISDKAFYESKLTEIGLPATLKTLGEYAFYKSTSLSKITIPEMFTVEGGLEIKKFAFDGCTALAAVDDEFVIPAGVTKIGVVAFRGCTGLANSTLVLSGETYLDDRVFVLNGDQEPIAFSKVVCKSKKVISMAGTATFGKGATKLPLLQVPTDLVDDYQKNDKWKAKFTTIEAIPAE